MNKPQIPPGFALVRIADLAAPGRPAPEPPRQPGSAWESLAIAVAMVTAALGRHDVDLDQLADGADPAGLIHVLVAMAAAGLRNCLAEASVERFLQDMGELAVYRGRGRDGRQL